MEIADVYVVNKSDLNGADKMAAGITSMLSLSNVSDYQKPPVVLTQADSGKGIDVLWNALETHKAHMSQSGLLETRRSERRTTEFLQILREELKNRLDSQILHSPSLNIIIDSIGNGQLEPYSEAMCVLEDLLLNLDLRDNR